MRSTVLLTGATGYIASHTWLALWAAGFDVVGVDDFSNSSPEVLNRLQRLSGRSAEFERVDVCDTAAMAAVFQRHTIAAVIHFAAFKRHIGLYPAPWLEIVRPAAEAWAAGLAR